MQLHYMVTYVGSNVINYTVRSFTWKCRRNIVKSVGSSSVFRLRYKMWSGWIGWEFSERKVRQWRRRHVSGQRLLAPVRHKLSVISISLSKSLEFYVFKKSANIYTSPLTAQPSISTKDVFNFVINSSETDSVPLLSHHALASRDLAKIPLYRF